MRTLIRRKELWIDIRYYFTHSTLLKVLAEYITQIINVGECKVLPLIKAWNGGVVTEKWMAKKTEKGIKFELLDSDMTMFNRRK